jgi:hypothetical protein
MPKNNAKRRIQTKATFTGSTPAALSAISAANPADVPNEILLPALTKPITPPAKRKAIYVQRIEVALIVYS